MVYYDEKSAFTLLNMTKTSILIQDIELVAICDFWQKKHEIKFNIQKFYTVQIGAKYLRLSESMGFME